MELDIICYRAVGGESEENSITGIQHRIRISPNW